PGRREPPARLCLAEQYGGKRGAELLAAEPREEHGGDLVPPWQQHGGARIDDDDRARVGPRDAPDELVPRAGEGEVGAVEALALDRVGRADDDDRDVGVRRRTDGALELRLRRPPGGGDPERERREHRAGRDLVAQAERDLAVRGELELGRALRRVEERRE